MEVVVGNHKNSGTFQTETWSNDVKRGPLLILHNTRFSKINANYNTGQSGGDFQLMKEISVPQFYAHKDNF